MRYTWRKLSGCLEGHCGQRAQHMQRPQAGASLKCLRTAWRPVWPEQREEQEEEETGTREMGRLFRFSWAACKNFGLAQLKGEGPGARRPVGRLIW